MSVFVDSGTRRYGRMIMCHMIADSRAELLEMAKRIGVQLRWLQDSGTYREHFDICQSKRALAVKLGAIEVTQAWLGGRLKFKRAHNKGFGDLPA